jgi:DNA-binding CsgD family transcriptional regulator
MDELLEGQDTQSGQDSTVSSGQVSLQGISGQDNATPLLPEPKRQDSNKKRQADRTASQKKGHGSQDTTGAANGSGHRTRHLPDSQSGQGESDKAIGQDTQEDRTLHVRLWKLKAMQLLTGGQETGQGDTEQEGQEQDRTVEGSLVDNGQRIADYLSGHPNAKQKDIADALDISIKTVQRHLLKKRTGGQSDSRQVDGQGGQDTTPEPEDEGQQQRQPDSNSEGPHLHLVQ